MASSSISARALVPLVATWRAAPGPGYVALADRIRLLVVDGRLAPGTRLPAERELAAGLGASRTTIASAYTLLRESGHLESVRGSGSVVRLPVGPLAPRTEDAPGLLNFSQASMGAAPGVHAAAARAAAALGPYLSEPGFDGTGRQVLREAIAERYRLRGLPTDPAQIVVTLGAQHAIALLARVLVARGDRALVESPGYPHAFQALREAGARLVPVGVTVDDGWDEEGLRQTLRRTCPSVAYLMPDFHNPTGRVMPADQRIRVLDAAAAEGTVVVADETMAELSIDDVVPQLPMAALGRAVMIGSVGKTLWGGLRIGWIRADTSLVARLVRARTAGDLGSPVLEQLLVADMLGDYDTTLAARRTHLRQGRDLMVAGLRARFPEWTVPKPAGGLTSWVSLGSPSSTQLTLAARRHGLQLAAGPLFGIDGAFERFIRIPFSYSAADNERALDALEAAWRERGVSGPALTDELAAVV